MKKIQVALIFLATSCFGCATPEEKPAPSAAPATGAAAKPAPTYRERASLTGSRLRPLDDDDTGTNAVSAVSKDDYINGRNSSQMPLRGQTTGGPFQ